MILPFPVRARVFGAGAGSADMSDEHVFTLPEDPELRRTEDPPASFRLRPERTAGPSARQGRLGTADDDGHNRTKAVLSRCAQTILRLFVRSIKLRWPCGYINSIVFNAIWFGMHSINPGYPTTGDFSWGTSGFRWK